MTVEDPIEYYIDGIGQTQVNTKVEMTFARGLRAILRQDPDVVMVGEIRDLETAQIAVQASLTGHLVLSTLHTNTAVGAVTRLRDMGIEPFLLSSSLVGVLAQRLVRVLNPATREAFTAGEYERRLLNLAGRRALADAVPPGPRDAGSGYRGRTGIYELIADRRAHAHDDPRRRLASTNSSATRARARPGIRDDGRAQGARGRHHDRGSPARHARGLTRPWAPSSTPRSTPRGRERKGVLEGDTAAPRAPAAARAGSCCRSRSTEVAASRRPRRSAAARSRSSSSAA